MGRKYEKDESERENDRAAKWKAQTKSTDQHSSPLQREGNSQEARQMTSSDTRRHRDRLRLAEQNNRS